ncbi:ATP-binding protein [Arcicella rigui]|uniref:ATP-binding protein n=1 Tax=Arcicella rigui TaxID=797020 RepID=A0ABU5Q777_9BACT|nr:ATP-binding protein [Arcicella rigui]MEA5138708.1 ATP-binding protein [Arcicella rigui]
MFERKIFHRLKEHLSKKQVTVITGMRRVGKSTALKYLLNETPHQNKLYLDFERIENRVLFNQNSYSDIERGLAALGLNLNQPAILALDEIQLVPNSTSVIKSLYDTYQIKCIATGSSSFYLKNHFSESLAGRKQIFEMTTLDFEEFLSFKGIDTQRIRAEQNRTFLYTYYDLWKGYYEEYLQFGGFPEVVLSELNADKKEYLKDIFNAYIELDIKLLSDFSVSDTLYKLILLLANRVGSRVDYSKIASLIGINRNKVKDYINLLEYTYFIQTVAPFTGGIDKELTKQPKLYFSDTGLLQECGQISSGALFENAIANQLSRQGTINYFEKSAGSEIDFILDRSVAFEVKETANQFDLNTLTERAKALNIQDCRLIGRYLPENGFKDFTWGGNIF